MKVFTNKSIEPESATNYSLSSIFNAKCSNNRIHREKPVIQKVKQGQARVYYVTRFNVQRKQRFLFINKNMRIE